MDSVNETVLCIYWIYTVDSQILLFITNGVSDRKTIQTNFTHFCCKPGQNLSAENYKGFLKEKGLYIQTLFLNIFVLLQTPIFLYISVLIYATVICCIWAEIVGTPIHFAYRNMSEK